MSKNIFSFILFLLLLTIFFSGCSTVMPTQAPQVTGRPTAEAATLTLQPTETKVVVLTPTPTPVPTLLSEQAIARMLSLYEDNGGCELPCWWGIIPGKTTWEEASGILSPIGVIVMSKNWPSVQDPNVKHYSFIMSVPYSMSPVTGQITAAFVVERDVVKVINIDSNWVKPSFDNSLAGMLTTCGIPEVWVKTQPFFGAGESYYDIFLYYPEKGSIWLHGVEEFVHDGIKICPAKRDSSTGPSIVLWSDQDAIALQNVKQGLQWDFFVALKPESFQRLEDANANMTDQSFYDTFTDPNADQCITLSSQAK